MEKGLQTAPNNGEISESRLRYRIPADVPLGTAAWYQFGRFERPICKKGDLFLGRLPTGESVGFRDDRHVLITAGTRSGKGASFLIPNICLWPGSIFCIDPKGENAMVTARRRAGGNKYCKGKGQRVHILDPFKKVSTRLDEFRDLKAAFNPLDLLLANSDEAVDIAAQIAESLIIKESSNDPFWEDAARSLLQALILHVASWKCYKASERNLATIWRLLRRGVEIDVHNELLELNGLPSPNGFAILFDQMRQNRSFDGVVADEGVRLSAMAEASPKAFNGMVQVACTNTNFMNSQQIRECLSRSTFSLSDLKTDPEGVSVYLCLPQRYMESHNRWLRMMVTLMIFEMEKNEHQPRSGHPVLTILDEFPSLNRMKVIENAVAQIAGYGVKLVMATQTLPQLKELYKDNWETLIANAGVKLFFGNDDHFTREYVAKLIGEREVVRYSRTYSETAGKSTSRTDGGSLGISVSDVFSSSHGFSYGSGGNSNVSNSYGQNSSSGMSSSSNWSDTSGESSSVMYGISESVQKRYLINPDEIGRFFGCPFYRRALALIAGEQPLCLSRVSYFKDDAFAGWFDWHPDHPLPRTIPQVEHDRKIAQEERQRELVRKRREEEVQEAKRLREEAKQKKKKEREYQEELRRSEEKQLRDLERKQREKERKEWEEKWPVIRTQLVGWTVIVGFFILRWLG
ncbi:MAG: type IV secretory system conjugative DNA transfer family protein [Hyphomicrobiaceae bacterium]|nr:type IV secretory system conjugative DNA transfer family protein [Hyphomicrobiaceae bacterium]